MERRWLRWLRGASVAGVAANAAVGLRHSWRVRGGRGTIVFGTLGVALPGMAEWYMVNRDGALRHHTYPQLAGVPLGATLGWLAITSAAQTVAEGLLARWGVGVRGRRWGVPLGTAAIATSLDLVLDPFGLALGLWEWRDGGPYAAEIAGPNGRRGIPVGNYLVWIGLTGGVAALYETAHGLKAGAGGSATKPPCGGWTGRCSRKRGVDDRALREAAALLLPYYLPAAGWALWQRRPGYLLASALCPVALAAALWPRRATPAGSRPHRA